ncbi:MAG: type 4a pilus biogenesis protein PilO [Candidatus Omnitrophota bacterium]
MKGNIPKKVFFLLLVIVDAVLLVSILVQSKSFFTVALETGKLQSRLNDFNRKKARIKNFKPQDLERERGELKNTLADKNLIFEVIKEVKSTAKTLSLPPAKVKLLTDEVKQLQQFPVTPIPFELKLECSYSQFIEFTHAIESMPYLLTISHLKVTRSEEKLPAIDVVMIINAYEKIKKNP